jgi:capsular polysaccharide biosynthesis protein
MVDVTLRGDTEIIYISVENTDPTFAASIANALATSFNRHTVQIMQVQNVTVIDRATAPTYPVKPRKALSVALAGLVGGFGGLGAAFVLDFFDDTFKTAEDVRQHLDLPVLVSLPILNRDDFTKGGGGYSEE